ncbi:MAG: AraC family transcriptional regulator [Acetatifactor sp.]|nr:AraC family transcriptional regulator [Acetatifactor sp.]
MPIILPEGKRITIKHNVRPADYRMHSMQMATDHYNIGYVISGDRRTITPTQSFDYHAGDVAMAPPFLYHYTIPQSALPYESYIIKFSPDFIEPFFRQIGKYMIDELYEQKVCHLTGQSQEKVKRMFGEMLYEYEKGTEYTEVILQGMLFRLFTTIWEERLPGSAVYFRTPLSEKIIRSLYIIEQNYDCKLTLEKLARESGLSVSYFSRLFSEQLGMSFTDYLSDVRIRHAQSLLAQTDKTIMEIALETGFCHGDYLATQFKAKTGMTPSQFRRNSR